MRIAIFINSLGTGGAERVSANLANAWSAAGNDVMIITLQHQEEDFYSVGPSIKRLSIGSAGASLRLWRAISANWARLSRLRKLIKREKPDILVGIMTRASVLAILAGSGMPCCVIATEHNHPPKLLPGKLWEFLRRATYKYADQVVALTAESAGWIRENCRCGNVSVIPNAVTWPIKRVEPILLPEAVIDDQRRIILGVGRLVEQKGFDYLIEAFRHIKSIAPDWDLVILGDGAARSHLENLIAEFGLEGRVFLPGSCGNITDWYSRAEIYVLSSRFEGFPMTLIEAMSMGLAVVSYNCDTGPRDIIESGQNGLLIEPVGDVPALVSTLEYLISNDPMRERLGHQASEVRNRYSEDEIVNQWAVMFSRLAEERVSERKGESGDQ